MQVGFKISQISCLIQRVSLFSLLTLIRVCLKLFGRYRPVSVRFSVGLPFRQIIDVVLDIVEDQFERQFRIDNLHFFCGSVDATPPGERVIGFFHGENLTF